jgi:hypothetical protein
LVVHGNTNREIALHLGITIDTVKVHPRHIFEKVGVERRTELAALIVANSAPVSDESDQNLGVRLGSGRRRIQLSSFPSNRFFLRQRDHGERVGVVVARHFQHGDLLG